MDQQNSILAIVASRFLTRFGDHAWDLAIPLLLIQLYPGNLEKVALYVLLTTIIKVVFLTPLGAWLDRTDRIRGVTLSIVAQLTGIIGVICAVILSGKIDGNSAHLGLFSVVIGCAAISQIGASLTHIAVASDWIPKIFKAEQFSRINSAIKRADLVAEILGPIASGLLLTLDIGFYLVALINLGSFIFELFILVKVYQANPTLRREGRHSPKASGNLSFLTSPFRALRLISAQYAGFTIFAYALLWFQVLTPHGSLITAFLKQGMDVSESTLGFFRAAGAFMGVVPTFFFAPLAKHFHISRIALVCVGFQALCMVAACLLLSASSIIPFLIAVALSRLGLYGFSLAELQIRQESVPEKMRAEVAGASASTCNLMVLVLFTLALFYSEISQFSVLAWASTSAAILATIATGLFVRRVNHDGAKE